MTGDFDALIPRDNTNSLKWEFQVEGETIAYRPQPADPLDPQTVLPLWVADMDFRCPQPVIDALAARARHGIFGYTFPTPSYFAAIGDWMQRRHGWTVEPDWTLTLPGVVPTIHFLIQTFTEPGDRVLIQPPVYHPFFTAIDVNGRQQALNPLRLSDGRYSIDFDDLEAQAADPRTKLAILCHPHNPIGRVWTAEEVRRFAAICLTHDVLIVSDEIHHDLIMPWAQFTTLGVACPEALERAVVCTAPSKTFNLPGLKTSNAFIPNPQLRAALVQTVNRIGLLGVNTFGLVALETAYRSGEAWLEEALAYIAENYRFLQRYVAEALPALRVLPLEGTYLAWVDCRGLGAAAATIAQHWLDEARVYLNDGAAFGPGGVGFVRINLACPRALLAAALERMRAALPG